MGPHHRERRETDEGDKLLCVLSALTEAIKAHTLSSQTQFEWMVTHSNFATKSDLNLIAQNIMSAISEFKRKQDEYNTRLETAIGGVSTDVESLNALILKLQGTQGEITPEDQAILDEIQAKSEALVTKLEGVDALTPPTPPNS